MRKLIICLIVAIILSNCEVKVKQTNAQVNHGSIGRQSFTIDGMQYEVFVLNANSASPTGITVVNVTRDKLQCEIITENLKKLKDGKANSGGN